MESLDHHHAQETAKMDALKSMYGLDRLLNPQVSPPTATAPDY